MKIVVHTVQIGFDFIGRHDMTVGQSAEIELDTRAHTSVEWHLINGDGAFATVHGRVIVPGRIEMRSVVGGYLHLLDHRTLTFEQLFDRYPEHRLKFLCTRIMIDIGNFWGLCRKVPKRG